MLVLRGRIAEQLAVMARLSIRSTREHNTGHPLARGEEAAVIHISLDVVIVAGLQQDRSASEDTASGTC